MDRDPGRLLPERFRMAKHEHGIKIDLSKPIAETLKELSGLKVGDALLLNGTIVVGRDIAHAKS